MPNTSGKRDEHRGGGRGFAGMEAEKQREIARKGGRAAHEKGTAHEFDSEEARAAGRKGGEVVSQNREHMAEIGAKGGHASHSNRHGSGGSNRARPQRSSPGMAATHEESGNVGEVQRSEEREDRSREAEEPLATRERDEEEPGG